MIFTFFLRLGCVILCTFSLLAPPAPYSIALVHIGESLPTYLDETIIQIRKFNKDCPCYLLANEKVFSKIQAQADAYAVTLIALEKLPKTPEHILFTAESRQQTAFTLYTKERFLYLYDFVKQQNLKQVFHLENDNMLYVDLNELLPLFMERYASSLGITFSNDNKGIAGFIYIPDAPSLQKLAHLFAQQANKVENDMTLLGLLRKAEKQGVTPLPIIMEEYVKSEKLKSPLGHTTKKPSIYCNNADFFDSLFDANLHGAYLGGVSPDYKIAGPGFLDEYCVVNASKLTYSWQIDSQGRKIPYAQYRNKKYRLNNLHIHSKKLGDFRS